MRVLLVDDSEDDRYLTARVLRAGGFEVFEADTVNDGVRLALQEWPAIVLCDMRITRAYEFVLRIKTCKFLPHVKVLALTGQSRAWGDQEKAVEAGFDGLLFKPLDISILRAAISNLGIHDERPG